MVNRWQNSLSRSIGAPTYETRFWRRSGESINGFDYDLFTEERPDGGKFRDFVPVAWLRHAEPDALFAVVEELIDIFGWAIDVSDGE